MDSFKIMDMILRGHPRSLNADRTVHKIVKLCTTVTAISLSFTVCFRDIVTCWPNIAHTASVF